jgi:hypothetical protein
MPSGAHLRKLRDKRGKAAASSESFVTGFLKMKNSSILSDLPEKHFQQM